MQHNGFEQSRAMRKSSMGFLVVSKELVRQSLTEPSAERRRKKSPDQPKPIGAKKGGEPPSCLLHRVTLSAIRREPLENQNQVGQTPLIVSLDQRVKTLLERILRTLLECTNSTLALLLLDFLD